MGREVLRQDTAEETSQHIATTSARTRPLSFRRATRRPTRRPSRTTEGTSACASRRAAPCNRRLSSGAQRYQRWLQAASRLPGADSAEGVPTMRPNRSESATSWALRPRPSSLSAACPDSSAAVSSSSKTLRCSLVHPDGPAPATRRDLRKLFNTSALQNFTNMSWNNRVGPKFGRSSTCASGGRRTGPALSWQRGGRLGGGLSGSISLKLRGVVVHSRRHLATSIFEIVSSASCCCG